MRPRSDPDIPFGLVLIRCPFGQSHDTRQQTFGQACQLECRPGGRNRRGRFCAEAASAVTSCGGVDSGFGRDSGAPSFSDVVSSGRPPGTGVTFTADRGGGENGAASVRGHGIIGAGRGASADATPAVVRGHGRRRRDGTGAEWARVRGQARVVDGRGRRPPVE